MSENATFLNPQSSQDEAIALRQAYILRDLVIGVTHAGDVVVARLAKPLVGAAAKAAAERKFVDGSAQWDPHTETVRKVTIKPLSGTGKLVRKRGRPPTRPQRPSNGEDRDPQPASA